MDDKKTFLINEFINKCFRDIADQDYIAARSAYRSKLTIQFLWSALQAIEKYLKAILLYNGKSTKKIVHSITKAYQAVLKTDDIEFDFPKGMNEFIDYLNEQGINRYFQIPLYTKGPELKYIDATVWYIRRYCFDLRGSLTTKDGEIIDLFESNIKKIQDEETIKKPNKYFIQGGFLEKVLQEKGSEARKQLVWKNKYYGKYRKKIIRKMPIRISAGSPVHFNFEEIFPELEKLVYFSKEIKEYFKKRS